MPTLERRVKDQIKRHVPITVWLPNYNRPDLRGDLISGMTVWGLTVPVAMAFAGLAGLPPESGLYAAAISMIAYAIFGTSLHLRVTASSTMSVMSAAVVAPLAGGNVERYIALSAALAIVVGVFLLVAGIIHLGFISDFLSKSVITGFVFGLALNIAVGQLPKVFGVPGTSGNFFQQVYGLLGNLSEMNPYTLAVGALALAIIYLIKRFVPQLPSGLVALGLGIVVSSVFHLSEKGVIVIGSIPTGLPSFGLPSISLSDLPLLAVGAVGIVFLAVGESIGAARSFAAKYRYEIDPNQEIIAYGAANIAAGFFQGFTVDASLSVSATADEGGAKTQLSALVTAAMVLLTLVLLSPIFRTLPDAVLGCIVIAAVVGLMNVNELKRYYNSNRSDFVLAVTALFGVLFTDVLEGLVIAVTLSLVIILYRASRPYVARLGQVPGQPDTYTDLARHPENQSITGLLIVRLDAPLYFLNANVARGQFMEMINESRTKPKAILIDLGASADLDIASLDMLNSLVIELGEMNIEVYLAQVRGGVRDRLRKAGIIADIGEDHIFRGVGAAVRSFQQRSARGQAPTAAGSADQGAVQP